MPHAQLDPVLRHLRRLAGSGAAQERSDKELLQQFAACHDEAAFAALVRRYGRLVLAVCRRVLGHEQDAQDAFQATFLVLAQPGDPSACRPRGGGRSRSVAQTSWPRAFC